MRVWCEKRFRKRVFHNEVVLFARGEEWER